MKALLICLFLLTFFIGAAASELLDGLTVRINRIPLKGRNGLFLMLFPVIFFVLSLFTDRIYREIFVFLSLGIMFFCGIICLKNVNHRLSVYIARVFLLIVTAETLLFNMNSYHLWLGDYTERQLKLSEAEIEGQGTFTLSADKKSLKILNDNKVVLYYDNIGQPVGTISAVVEYDNTCFTVNMEVDITDETHATYRNGIVKQKIYRFAPLSQITPCHLSGEVGLLRLSFESEQEKTSYTISDIWINKPIPFSVSPLRVILVLALALLIYALLSRSFEKKVIECEAVFKLLSYVTAFIAILLSVIMVMAKVDASEGIFSVFFKESGDQMTKELVDAFEAGQLSLLTKPTKELLSLSNPYDWSLRELSEADYLWDHVLYNGKYYSYYGIAPVILLYLPFHLLTGYYFPTNISVMLFACIGLLFLVKTYMVIVRDWFKNISLSAAYAGELVLVTGCGIYYAVGRPKFYEAAVTAGFMFLTIGTWLLLSSGLLRKGKTNRLFLALSSLFLALAVLSRPTMAVYCICACVFFLSGFLRERREKQKGAISFWLCAMLPMACLGVVQMVYNYLRFDSPFDFGIGYSLTINDFTRVSYHTIYVLILLYNYIFAPVKLSAEYPVISADFNRLSANGYFFKDTGNTPGVLFVALPVFAYLFAGRALKLLPEKKRKEAVVLLGLPCLVMPFITIFAAWNSGYAARYLADFSWEIIMGALAIIFFLCSRCRNRVKLSFANKAMCFFAVWAIVVNAVNIFNFCFRSTSYPYMAYELEQFFCFWK